MRILHLAYEDPLQPGSGGGSVRTLEINSRLARNHKITAFVSGYKGAKERYSDGIHWIPVGTSLQYTVDKLTYFATVGLKLKRQNFDLLVEDFGAPFSTAFSPLFTKKPVIASVQWLFADQMREKYHLPVDKIEQYGLGFYDNFITVSQWLADTIKARHPKEVLTQTVPNGIEDIAFSVEPNSPKHLIFVGRLDIAQKGCDLLLQAVQIAYRELKGDMPQVLIVGDGPDKLKLEALVADYEIASVVKFCGRVMGLEKYQLMADSYAVLMPSRFETFGMVAAEAQAAAAPIISFDVGPLAEVSAGGGARLIKPFDINAFAQEIVYLVQHQAEMTALRSQGRSWARRYNWDTLAAQQEQVYLQALERQRIP